MGQTKPVQFRSCTWKLGADFVHWMCSSSTFKWELPKHLQLIGELRTLERDGCILTTSKSQEAIKLSQSCVRMYREFLDGDFWVQRAVMYAELVHNDVLDESGTATVGWVAYADWAQSLVKRIREAPGFDANNESASSDADLVSNFAAQVTNERGITDATRAEEQLCSLADDSSENLHTIEDDDIISATAAVKDYCKSIVDNLTPDRLATMRQSATFTIHPPNPFIRALDGSEPLEFDAAPFHYPVIDIVDPLAFFGMKVPCPTHGWDHADSTSVIGTKYVTRFVRQPGKAGNDELRVIASRDWCCRKCGQDKQCALQNARTLELRNDPTSKKARDLAKAMTWRFRAWDPRVMDFYRSTAATLFIPTMMYDYCVYHKTALPGAAMHEITVHGASASSEEALSKRWTEGTMWNRERFRLAFYSVKRRICSATACQRKREKTTQSKTAPETQPRVL